MADRLAQELERHFQRSRWRSAQDLVFAHPLRRLRSRCLQGAQTLHARAAGRRRADDHVPRAAPHLRHTDGGGRRASARDPGMDGPWPLRRTGGEEIDRGTRVPTRRLSMTGEGRSTALADELAPRADVGLSARAWAGSPSPSSPRFPQGLLRTPLRKGDCAGISRKEDRLGRARAQRAASRSTRATGARGRPPARWRVRRPGDVAPPRGSFVG
jgi:hypothetical protein